MVINNKTVDSVRSETMCVSDTCVKKNKKTTSKFCPDCGQEIQRVDFPVKKTIDAGNFLYQKFGYSDDMCCLGELIKNKTVMIPNGQKGRPCRVDSIECDYGSPSATNLSVVDQKADIDWLRSKFNQAFATCRVEFGEDNVSFEWGVIVSWS